MPPMMQRRLKLHYTEGKGGQLGNFANQAPLNYKTKLMIFLADVKILILWGGGYLFALFQYVMGHGHLDPDPDLITSCAPNQLKLKLNQKI